MQLLLIRWLTNTYLHCKLSVSRYANSFINPLIYAFVNKDFKMAFRALLCCRNFSQQRLDRRRESVVNGPMTRSQWASLRRNSYLTRSRPSDPERPQSLSVRSQNSRRSLQMIVPPAIPLQRVSLSFSGPSTNGYIGVGGNGSCNANDSPQTPDEHSAAAPTVSTIAEERSEDLTDGNSAAAVAALPRFVVTADSPLNHKPTFLIQTPDSPSTQNIF